MSTFIVTLLSGALFVFGVIAGIGPQNLNIMTHAIRRNHEYHVAITCFIGDVILILLACGGLQLARSKWLLVLINVIGIIFLSYYLWLKLRNLNEPHDIKFSDVYLDKKTAIFRALALTWLNPLVFIDTIIVIGGASTHYTGLEHTAFTVGAVIGDGIWLFGLTIISRVFADKLNRPRVWMVIDIATIVIVAYILIKMVSFLL